LLTYEAGEIQFGIPARCSAIYNVRARETKMLDDTLPVLLFGD
jgi:hypothetical protein